MRTRNCLRSWGQLCRICEETTFKDLRHRGHFFPQDCQIFLAILTATDQYEELHLREQTAHFGESLPQNLQALILLTAPLWAILTWYLTHRWQIQFTEIQRPSNLLRMPCATLCGRGPERPEGQPIISIDLT